MKWESEALIIGGQQEKDGLGNLLFSSLWKCLLCSSAKDHVVKACGCCWISLIFCECGNQEIFWGSCSFKVSFQDKLGNTAVENWVPPQLYWELSSRAEIAVITDFCYSVWDSQSPLQKHYTFTAVTEVNVAEYLRWGSQPGIRRTQWLGGWLCLDLLLICI